MHENKGARCAPFSVVAVNHMLLGSGYVVVAVSKRILQELDLSKEHSAKGYCIDCKCELLGLSYHRARLCQYS